MNERALVQKNTRYREARNLLEQRSILPVNGDYTTRQLAEELLELPHIGGHSIIGQSMPMRRCSHAPWQPGVSRRIQS